MKLRSKVDLLIPVCSGYELEIPKGEILTIIDVSFLSKTKFSTNLGIEFYLHHPLSGYLEVL